MVLNLKKGQRVEVGLRKVRLGLGWNPNSTSGAPFDLDVSLCLLQSGKVVEDGHFIFYNNLASPDGSVRLEGDSLDGAGDGDDEVAHVDLTQVASRVEEILVVVSIHEYEERKQNFGQVRNSYIRITDESNGTELCRYELDEDFSIESAVEFGRLYRKADTWRFEAVGRAFNGGLQYVVDQYYAVSEG
ncbi:MAG: TerD family protein [Planctomyces sp.]|nr:TerD family protein [Planctomyces sp.]